MATPLTQTASGLKPIDQAALQALVEYQRRWLDSLKPEDPSKPEGQRYGYGIAQVSWGTNTIYFHGGETPGYNSKISYDPTNQMTLIRVDQSSSIAGRPADRQYPLGESARSHLQSVTAGTSALGDHHALSPYFALRHHAPLPK